MTAIIALMNKKGAAIAADSAVTRPRVGISKITNNSNKMVRLSDRLPISVMISGNSKFLSTPWDIIARRYRQISQGAELATVEDCALDFLHYLQINGQFWDKEYEKERLREMLYSIVENLERTARLSLSPPHKLAKVICEQLEECISQQESKTCSSQMEGYGIDDFTRLYGPFLNNEINNLCSQDDELSSILKIKGLPSLLSRYLHAKIKAPFESPHSTLLIFAGFGRDQQFPSVVTASVHGGYSGRVVYQFENTQSLTIGGNRPSAILYFAQDDVVRAILRGAEDRWVEKMKEYFLCSLQPSSHTEHMRAQKLADELSEEINSQCRASVKRWEGALETMGLRDMAALAESLISLTSHHRKLTFSQEGVGGEIDLAVITKEDGFIWLNRKSWYHHKDVGGKYGHLGV